jgi:hypothetical protein
MWTKAVFVPAERLLSEETSGLPDAFLLVVALRNVHRAGAMAAKSLTRPQARQLLADALQEFDAAVPGLVEARDVIEHFDEYTVGQGREQVKLTKGGSQLSPAALAEQFAPRLEGPVGGWAVRVGKHLIEVAKVPDAATRLLAAIRAAAEAEDS